MGRFHPLEAEFSKSPHLHSSVLENLNLAQASRIKPLHPSFHFSSVNYGYYCLFLYSSILFLVPVAARLPARMVSLRVSPKKQDSHRSADWGSWKQTAGNGFQSNAASWRPLRGVGRLASWRAAKIESSFIPAVGRLDRWTTDGFGSRN
jgi:hypothetical protein